MSVRFLALVVVYGREPSTTPSLQTLVACQRGSVELRVLVWDNSPTSHPPEPLRAVPLAYVSTPANLGLSVIYNRVAAEHLRPGEHLLLLDQDSLLEPDFLIRASQAIERAPDVDLFLPLVEAHGRQVSPLTYMLGWGRTWTHRITGRVRSTRVCAINSGMIISERYLRARAPVYDEALRFYGTDTQFMLDYAEQRRELVVLNTVIRHDLSFFSGTPGQRAARFSQMRSALLHIYSSRPWSQRLVVHLVMAMVAVRYAIRFRDLRFVRGHAL